MDAMNLDFSRMEGDELDAVQQLLETALGGLDAVRRSRKEKAEAAEQAFYDRLPDVVSHIRKDGRSFVMQTDAPSFFVEMPWHEWVALAHAVIAADMAAREI
ncbi:hypothetical protein GGQ99_005110 [Aminobacter niigataensis]|uniref:Uncharacterized protein n=1 Tax=Aminobacter niigataensis TaxID=83265 RepID=A0ABR6L9A9_9HYPH|nr:hypothetical protein [Aminobacter niigataensis]MBB4653320.1 hypothetical protein [Aminobacter niigataensis]